MVDLSIWRLWVALILGVVFIVVGRYRWRAQHGQRFSTAEEGKALMIPLRLVGVMLWLYPWLFVLAPGWILWSLVALPEWLHWMGVGGALLVLPWVAWAQQHLGNNVTPTVITRDNHQLITTGPYRWVRHPLYTGGAILFTALALIMGSWLIALVTLVGALFLLLRLPKEEAMLATRFGDTYRAYQQRTGAFVPRL